MVRKIVYIHHFFFLVMLFLITLQYENAIMTYKTSNPSNVVREHLLLEEEGIITGLSSEDGTIRVKTVDGLHRTLTDVSQEVIESILRGEIEGSIMSDTYDYKWRSPKNKLMFDYDKYLFANNIEGRFSFEGFIAHPIEGISTMEKTLYRLRMKFYQFTYRLPATKTKDMLMAILWHETDGLGSYEAYTQLGIAHLFTLSGLHFGLIYIVMRKCIFMGPYRLRKVALCILLVLFYAILGSGYASLRALLMILYIEIASLINRQPDRLTMICVSNIVLLCFYPRAILSTGYLLSFYAYTVIAYVMPVMMPSLASSNSSVDPGQMASSKFTLMLGKARRLLIYYIILQGLLMPITLYFFKQYNIWSFLVNMIFIPVFSIFVPILLFWCLTYAMLPSLAIFFLPLLEKFFLGLELLIDKMPLISISIPIFNRLDLFIMVAFLFCFTFFKAGVRWRQRAMALTKPIMTLGIFFLLVYEVFSLYSQPLVITTFDVGHGDATLISYHKSTILIDTGSAYAHLDEILKAQGIHTLNYVILSHSHEDHIGGFIALQKNIPVEKVLCLSDAKDVLLSNGAQNFETLTTNSIVIDDLTLSIGTNRSEHEPNDNGLWVWLKLGEFDGVFLGDYSKETIETLKMPFHIEWLKVAHHGSKTSLPDEFLRKHTVETAVVSHQLKYRLPSQEVVSSFETAGSQVKTTFISGQMSWRINGDKVTYKDYFSKWY